MSGLERGIQADALRRAAGIVAEVRATLNVRKADACGSCGLRKQANWSDSKAHRALTTIIEKLAKTAKHIEEDPEEGC